MTSDHWLFRLDADAWLRAAEGELAAGDERLEQRRAAITHARRAGGMGLNAVLVAYAAAHGDPEGASQRWGRSYLDHLRALPQEPDLAGLHLPTAAAERAQELLTISPVVSANGPRGLVPLGLQAHAPARRALTAARELVDACAAAITALRAS